MQAVLRLWCRVKYLVSATVVLLLIKAFLKAVVVEST
jgi:hypothetical protein